MTPRLSPVDHAFRTEWAPLVATLVADTGSLELAEDAVSEAFVEASVRWRTDGAPRRPGAWLLTTARNKAVDRMRRDARFRDRLPRLAAEVELHAAESHSGDAADRSHAGLGDDQLALIAGCAHPALATDAQVALTLRYVCGLSTEQIARAFLVPTETMKKRLARAKRKIDLAGVPFSVPDAARLGERVSAICGVIYGVFSEGYASAAGPELVRGSLCDEAAWLAELLAELLPDDGEVAALAALIQLTDSRRHARTDEAGLPVLLEHQDRERWDRRKIVLGLAHLERCAELGGVGPYRLLASIAGLHARAPCIESTPWDRIAALYGALIAMADSPVLRLNQAAAIARSEGPATGLALMDGLADQLDQYSYFHAARAALLAELERSSDAVVAYDRAISVCANEAEITWMRARRDELVAGDG